MNIRKNSKTIICILLFLSVLSLCSCVGNNGNAESSSDKTPPAPGQLEFQAEKNGVELKVTLEKSPINENENLKLVAEVINKTGKVIGFSLPTSTPMNLEIRVSVKTEDGKEFLDADTYQIAQTAMMKDVTLKDGETITQSMTLVPGTIEYEDVHHPFRYEFVNYYPPGKCKGEAKFNWGIEGEENSGDTLVLEFDFEIV